MIALFNSASSSPTASFALLYPTAASAKFAIAPGIAPKNDDTLPTTPDTTCLAVPCDA